MDEAIMAMPDSPRTDGPGPQLSVVLACLGGYQSIARTVSALLRQTVREKLQLIIVASTGSDITLDQDKLSSFHSVLIEEVEEIKSVAKANALGARAASAPVVVFAEDHAFPLPGWAAALIRAHRMDWAAVGPVVRNANPQTTVSWADFLIGYGPWLDPAPAQEVDFLPGHNSSYKRFILLEYDRELESMLEAETVLHWDLRSKGHRLYLQPEAKLAHTNFSLFSSWRRAQYHCGRVFAGTRIKTMVWLMRLSYFAAAPLIPLVRLWRILQYVKRADRADIRMIRVLPLLFFGLVLDGIGQMVGYAFGMGGSKEKLAHFEFHRFKHVTPSDQQTLLS